ncbi:MAG: sensor histidine kinase [Candidatus Kapaibacteriota bacterium]
MRDYLALERLRFEDRLQWSFRVPSELESLPIPPMTLQILVENAVKHGIEETSGGGAIQIEAETMQSEVFARVINTGKLKNTIRGNGIGLEKSRERLRLLFGASADITLKEVCHFNNPPEKHYEVIAEIRYTPHRNTLSSSTTNDQSNHDRTHR